MRELPHMQPKTYEDAVAEGRRVADLRREVHIAMLAEYVRVKFLSDMGKIDAYEKFLADIEIGVSVFTLYNWMRGTAVWLKVAPSVREEHRAFLYYVEAASNQAYRSGKLTASEAVRKAKARRHDRNMQHQLYALSAMADSFLDRNPPTWIDAEFAADLLERLPAVEVFLRKAASRRRSA